MPQFDHSSVVRKNEGGRRAGVHGRMSPDLDTIPLLHRPLTDEEKRAGIVILKGWHRFIAQKTRRDLGKMYGTLRTMAKPIGTLDQFMEHLLKERVLVQANVYRPRSGIPVNGKNFRSAIRPDERYSFSDRPIGHFGFFHVRTKYELKLGQDKHANSRKFVAKYPSDMMVEGRLRILMRSYIKRDDNFMRKSKEFLEDISALIDNGLLLVLDEKYSKNFEQAIDGESNFFKDQPYSYGLHYNCLSFAQGVLDRLLESTPAEPPSLWACFRAKLW